MRFAFSACVFFSRDFHNFLQPPALIYTTFDHALPKQQFSTTMQCFCSRLTNKIFSTSYTQHSTLSSVSCGQAPLRIGQRWYRDQPQILQLSLGHRSIISCVYIYLASDRDWSILRASCAQIFVFWGQPTEVTDPPVAIPFGPHIASDSGSDSD